MRPVTLTLIVHDHQPVGNFDGVIDEATREAYAPFLEFLETHPTLRIGLHTSGPLLQWLALHQADYLKRLRVLVERGQVELWDGGEGRLAVLGDDGEKFGVWPGTHALCYERGWLARFVAALAANPWIELRTPGEAIAHHRPLGLAYLPSATYHEMQEWSLPPAAQARYHAAAGRLGGDDAAHDLVRGGHWRNFFSRYPESNRLHKRMLKVSRRLWEQPRED